MIMCLLRDRKRYSHLICQLDRPGNTHCQTETRRLCVLANTKLYHRNLLLLISMKFWILDSTTLGLFSKDPPIYPNIHTVDQNQTLLRITHLAHRKSYLVIICPIHMKSWPKVKLGQVQVGSNIAQNHSSSP